MMLQFTRGSAKTELVFVSCHVTALPKVSRNEGAEDGRLD